jgi:hypothetical protein
MAWMADERLPANCASGRVIPAGPDRVLLAPATSIGRSITPCVYRASSADGRPALELGAPITSRAPTAVFRRADGAECWAWGKEGKLEVRTADDVTSELPVPTFDAPFASAGALFGIGLLNESRLGVDLLRLAPTVDFCELWPVAILGADSAGCLIVLCDAPGPKRMLEYASPAEVRRLAIVDPETLEPRATAWLDQGVHLPFARGSLLTFGDGTLALHDWSGSSAAPRAVGMTVLDVGG